MSKTYSGKRTPDGAEVLVRDGEGSPWIPLDPRHDLWAHAERLDWGSCNRGAAQLALAMLADCIGRDRAYPIYQEFKRIMLSRLGRASFVVEEADVLRWVASEELRGSQISQRLQEMSGASLRGALKYVGTG